MSIVIIGGNECMVRQYKDLCKSYQYRPKIIPKMEGNLKNKIGNPDLMVLFTNTMSHKMLRCALNETKGQNTVIARCKSSSMSALRSVLEEHSSKGS